MKVKTQICEQCKKVKQEGDTFYFHPTLMFCSLCASCNEAWTRGACQHPNAYYHGDTYPPTYKCDDCGLTFVSAGLWEN